MRFHRPEKFGDNLAKIRKTVEWVNTNQSSITGFEEGRIFHGFRNVFPLFLETNQFIREHIGSVEISYPAYALVDKYLSWQKNAKIAFLVKNKTISNKLFEDEKTKGLTQITSSVLF